MTTRIKKKWYERFANDNLNEKTLALTYIGDPLKPEFILGWSIGKVSHLYNSEYLCVKAREIQSAILEGIANNWH